MCSNICSILAVITIYLLEDRKVVSLRLCWKETGVKNGIECDFLNCDTVSDNTFALRYIISLFLSLSKQYNTIAD